MLKHLLLIATFLLLSSGGALACMTTNRDGSLLNAEQLQAMCGEGKYFDDIQCDCVEGENPDAAANQKDQPPPPICDEGRTKDNTKCWAGYYFDETTCKCARYQVR